MKTNLPNLMTGFLWFVSENENGTEPISLKEFKNNVQAHENPSALLSRGNIIAKERKIEKHIIFDCFQKWNDQISSFRLFLYEEGIVRGRIEYPVDYNLPKDFFKGSYKQNSKTKISIWGVWSVDPEYKERYLTLIELNK